MRKLISRHFDFINGLLARRYRLLLISLIGMVLFPGFLTGTSYEGLVTLFMNTLVVFIAIYCIQESRKQLYYGAILASMVILINQFGIFEDNATITFYLSFIIYILFYGFVAYRLLRKIIMTEKVNMGVIYAAVIVYVLMGVIGGYLFMLNENIHPGSLQNLQIENITHPSGFIYFSFTTLNTLGYGDIAPISSAARSLSMLLSCLGPLYLTVLIALLVSRFEHHD